MSSHNTWQHLHVTLADTGVKGCHFEQSQQVTCFREKDKVFKGLPNVFGIPDRDHDIMQWRVLLIFQEGNLKLNKDKFHFRCSSFPFFGEIISRHDVKPDPRKLNMLTEISPKHKKGIANIPWNSYYLSKFSSSTAEVCESVRWLTSAYAE